MTLLIVDDNKEIVGGMMDGIDWAEAGFDKVYGANSAFSAKKILKETDIDVMLCDIEMPGENGLELVAWVREQGFHTACIFLTSHAAFDYAREAVSLGAVDYILQPAKYSKILETVKKAVSKHIREEELLDQERKYKELNFVHTESEDSDASEIIKYIRKNISRKITRTEIAEKMGFHEDTLTKMFKRETGYNLKEFIMMEKIGYAKNLLETTRISVSEIAIMTGFESFSYFSNAFKKSEGISPVEYRSRANEK